MQVGVVSFQSGQSKLFALPLGQIYWAQLAPEHTPP